MKILFFHRWLGVHYGGTETHVKSLASLFVRKGHEVSILTRQGNALNDLDSRIKIYRVSKNFFESDFSYDNPFLLYFHTGLFMVKSFFYLFYLSLVKGQRYDVISVHFATEAVVARVYRWLFKTPFVFVLEGYTRLEAKEAQKANATIAISQNMVEEIYKNYGYRPNFLPVGIDAGVFNTQVDGTEERKNLLGDFQKLVLTVGRIEPRKDYPTLIRAAKIIKERKLSYRFLIVGDGIDRLGIQKMIGDLGLSDEILMLGAVSEERKARLYKASDLFALPTLYEGFGIVFVEAMACGLPVVSTHVGAVSEVVQDAGRLVPPSRPSAFADTISEVLENDLLARELASRAVEVSKKYYWANLVDKYEAVYFDAARKK